MHRVAPAVIHLRCPHAQACYLRKRPHEADVRIGVDPGNTAGLALVIDAKVVWAAEIHHRSKHIRKKLGVRRGARSARRCRRKRKAGRAAKPARWRHRTRPAGWLPPSVCHRVDAPLRWIRFLLPYARAHAGTRPVHAHVEVCAFDSHKVLHPEVEGEAYQRGPLWRANLRGYVLTRALTITMTGRGRRAVVKHNASGFPRLNQDGTIVRSYRSTPPHGLRAGDSVRIDKAEIGRRRRIGTLRTARHDGRCTVETHNGTKRNVMASTLTLVHRGCGARIQ